MALSQLYLELASDVGLHDLRRLRRRGFFARKRGEFTSYTEEETTADVALIDAERWRRADLRHQERQAAKAAKAKPTESVTA